MDKVKALTRQKLKEIATIEEYNDITSKIILSEEEQQILNLHYIKGETITDIADRLGLSESSVKKKHSKILLKIGKAF